MDHDLGRTGVVVVAVTAVFLVLIGNSLGSINANLATADGAVTDVAGHTKTLPDQIADVNAALPKIDRALVDLPGDTEQITANLDGHPPACAPSTPRSWTPPRASTTCPATWSQTSDLVVPIASRLADTSGLLRQILGSTGRIHTSLVEVNGAKDCGLAGIDAFVRYLNDHLATSGDLGDILAGLTDINGHLGGICRSTAVNLLHGVPIGADSDWAGFDRPSSTGLRSNGLKLCGGSCRPGDLAPDPGTSSSSGGFAVVALILLTRTLVASARIDADIRAAVNPEMAQIGATPCTCRRSTGPRGGQRIADAADPLHDDLAATGAATADVAVTTRPIARDVTAIGASIEHIDASVTAIRASVERLVPLVIAIRADTGDISDALAGTAAVTEEVESAVADIVAGLTTADRRADRGARPGSTARSGRSADTRRTSRTARSCG